MQPFSEHQPKISLDSSIGNGVSFLNKTLSAKMFGHAQSAEGAALLLEFLAGFKYQVGAGAAYFVFAFVCRGQPGCWRAAQAAPARGCAHEAPQLCGAMAQGESLLLSSRVNSVPKLRHALLRADRLLERLDDEEAISRVDGLAELGFLPG